MCTPDFMDAMIPVPESGGRVSDRYNRENRNPFERRDPQSLKDAGIRGIWEYARDEKGGRDLDAAILRRSGMSEKEAKQLSAFAAHRGGLDAFANIEAARRAFRDSGAFTERAKVPAATREVSRVSLTAPQNETKVGATDLIGLPLIRRG